MAKVREEKQEIRVVSWAEYEILLEKLAKKMVLKNNISKSLYGIPRGGLIVAICLTHVNENFSLYPLSKLFRVNPVKSDIDSIIVIDDIIDSGDTAHKFFDYYELGTLFWRVGSSFEPDYYAEKLDSDVWIRFPWEKSA